jgi:hypothetical protein
MAQNTNSDKSLLETIAQTLESELLENEEVESKTEEVVAEAATEEVVEETSTEETVEEASVFKVWGEDEEQDAEEEVSETEESEEEPVAEEEDDGIDGTKDPDEDPSDAEVMDEDDDEEESDEEDDVDVDDVDISADDAEDDVEDEAEAEVGDDEEEVGDDEEGEDDEEEVEEAEELADVQSGDSDEDDGIDGAAEPDQDVDDAINQISKTITAAAAAKAKEKIEASYSSMKEDLDVLCAEDDTLSEEFKTKAATIFEAAVTAKVREHVEDLKESYADIVQEEVKELHEGLVDKIDSYLTYVAEQWIQKNEVGVTNVLRTEITESFMASIKESFENHYIEMPEGKTDMFDEVSQQNAELSESVEAKQEEIDSLQEQINTLQKAQIVSDLSEGLVATDATKFKALTQDIVFESSEQFTKKAKIIRESYFSKKSVKKEIVQEEQNTNTTETVTLEEVKEEKAYSDIMSRYLKASSKLESEAF